VSRYHDVVLSRTQAWSTLALTVGCEVAATLLVKLSDGFTRPLPSAGAVIGFALTMVLLAKVLEVIPTSIAYTVWTGAGSALIAVLGVALLGEALSVRAVGGIALVVVGVTVLNLSDRPPARIPRR
jgi:multidrug transporter EmrE-like cation transporter